MKYLLKKLIHYADKAIACLIILAVIITMIPAGIYASESNSETPPESSFTEEESDFSPEQEDSTSTPPSASDDEELIAEESTDGEETEIELGNEESSPDNPGEPSSEEIPTIEEAPSEELSPSESEESPTPPDESENEAQDDEESSEPEPSSGESLDVPTDPSEFVEENVEESETETEAESTAEEMPPESTEPVESTEEASEEETAVEEDPEPYTGYVDIGWGNAYAEAITVKVVEDGEPATKASNSGARLVKYTDTETKIKPASTMELRYDNDYLRNVIPGWEDNTAYALFGPGAGGFPVKYIYDYNGYSYSNGEVCFCIVPESPTYGSTDYDGETEDSAVDWKKFSGKQQEAIKLILAFGFPTEDYSVANDPAAAALANTNPGGFAANAGVNYEQGWKMAEQYVATQLLIWEIIMGYRDVHTYEFRKGQELVDFYSTDYATLHNCYDSIVALLKAHNQVPSFMSKDSSTAPTYTLVPTGASVGYTYRVYDSNGSDGLYDTNAVLADYYTLYDSTGKETQFPVSGINLKIAKGGNRLYIAADDAAAEYIRSKGSLSFSFDGTVGSPSGSCVIYSDPKGQSQTLVKANLYPDPINGYFNLEVEANLVDLQILKVDENGAPLLGATLVLLDAAGNVVEPAWVSGNTAHKIDPSNVEVGGTYILRELKAPEGYEVSEDYSFIVTDRNTPITVEFTNYREIDIQILKVDENGAPLPGATLVLLDAAGNVVEPAWVSGNTAHKIDPSNVEVGGTYILRELKAPEGYEVSEDYSFIVTDRNTPITVEFTNYREIDLEILKVDENGAPLPGATLVLLDAAGNVVEPAWVSGATAHKISPDSVEVGKTYIVREIAAPEGYATAKDMSFVLERSNATITVRFANTPISISIEKIDASNPKKYVKNATLQILDGDTVIDTWVTDSAPHEVDISLLTIGKEYTLVETNAPTGYQLMDPVTFIFEGISGQVVTAINYPITGIFINKVDQYGNHIAGAELELYSGNLSSRPTTGKGLIDKWTTDGSPHMLIDSSGDPLILPSGQYTIFETKYPDGCKTPLGEQPTAKHFYIIGNLRFYEVNFENYRYEANVKILKTDEAGVPLEGVTLVLEKQISGSGSSPGDSGATGRALPLTPGSSGAYEELCRWNTTEENPKTIERLGLGIYRIREINAPPGFSLASPIIFLIDEGDDGLTLEYTMTNNPTIVRIAKVDAAGSYVSGAKLELRDGVNGRLIEAWTTGDSYKEFKGLVAGCKYVITETEAPNGYAVSRDKVFVVSSTPQVQTITFTNNKLPSLALIKVDANKNPVAGANLALQIKDANGEWATVDAWTSTAESTNGNMIRYAEVSELTEIVPGEYVFVVESGENFFALAQEDTGSAIASYQLNILSLGSTIDSSAIVDSIVWQVGGTPEQLTIGDNNGNYLHISTSGKSTTLDFGSIGPTSFQVLDNFQLLTEIAGNAFSIPTQYRIFLSGTSFTISPRLEGSSFRMFRKIIVENSDLHSVQQLPYGQYRLLETNAPDGYVTADPVEFSLNESHLNKTIPITMANYPTATQFVKIDEAGRMLPGAKLRVVARATDGTDTVIDEWTSSTSPHEISGLLTKKQAEAAGITYYLQETEAPPGYRGAQEIMFSVSDSIIATVVTMENVHFPSLYVEKVTPEGEWLPDAFMALYIQENDGWSLVSRWTSAGSPMHCGYLQNGYYRIVEISAPEGYYVAPSVEFELDTDRYRLAATDDWISVENNTITIRIVDEPKIPVDTGIFIGADPALIVVLSAVSLGLVPVTSAVKKRKKKDDD